MACFSEYQLGCSANQVLPVNTRNDNAIAVLELAKQCRQKLAIISHELDPFVYDQFDFVEAVHKLVLKNHHAKIRIIVFEPKLIIHRGHKLLNLTRQISSFIKIRRASTEYNVFNQAILIADEIGYLFRKNMECYKGQVNFNNQREAKYLLNIFNSMWGKAKSNPNLHGIHI